MAHCQLAGDFFNAREMVGATGAMAKFGSHVPAGTPADLLPPAQVIAQLEFRNTLLWSVSPFRNEPYVQVDSDKRAGGEPFECDRIRHGSGIRYHFPVARLPKSKASLVPAMTLPFGTMRFHPLKSTVCARSARATSGRSKRENR